MRAWDRITGLFGAMVVAVVLSVGITALANGEPINQGITVSANKEGTPQGAPDNVIYHFTAAPNEFKDEIYVDNNHAVGVSAGVYNDPVHDGALLTITKPSALVTASVEGRKGIGAIYNVVVRIGPPLPGYGGGPGTDLRWADIGDMKTADALVIKDVISGRGKADKTDTDQFTSTLECVPSSEGLGKIEFWLIAESGSYTGAIRQDSNILVEYSLNRSNGWRVSHNDLAPGSYQVVAMTAGGGNFKRRVDVFVPTTWNYVHPELFELLSEIIDSEGAAGAKLANTINQLTTFDTAVNLVLAAYSAANAQNANATLWELLWGGGAAVKPGLLPKS